ncbi:uncharacterized protein K441DRAFT_668787 [Cenococcum geophilum 1.58]|uniref:uncharacterized protein n=1 Tax=Cenococcum geophilum 1.58 TaxID=794803 RepID=UPI00358E80BA|nr:hypothetical protein K441DRAFT_668787 [Cenococcum geophilum 1.58]
MDKKSSRRLFSKGRVLTQEDEYKEGTSLLELNVALYTRLAAFAHVFQCNPQPIEDFEECSSKPSNWLTPGAISRP